MKPLKIGNDREGITLEFVRSRNSIWITGRYDSIVGYDHARFTLKEFFDRLSITKKDVLRAFDESPESAVEGDF